MMIRVVMLFEAYEHFVEHLDTVAAQHFLRSHVPKVAKLIVVYLESCVQSDRMKKRLAIGGFGMSERSVEVEDEGIEVHEGSRVRVRGFRNSEPKTEPGSNRQLLHNLD